MLTLRVLVGLRRDLCGGRGAQPITELCAEAVFPPMMSKGKGRRLSAGGDKALLVCQNVATLLFGLTVLHEGRLSDCLSVYRTVLTDAVLELIYNVVARINGLVAVN